MHIECLVHGNVNKTKALELANIVEERLRNTMKMCPLLPRQLLLNRELKLEKGCYYLYEIQNDIHKPSCIELYYQCGIQSTESNMKLELFSKIIQEPCFDILRTKVIDKRFHYDTVTRRHWGNDKKRSRDSRIIISEP